MIKLANICWSPLEVSFSMYFSEKANLTSKHIVLCLLVLNCCIYMLVSRTNEQAKLTLLGGYWYVSKSRCVLILTFCTGHIKMGGNSSWIKVDFIFFPRLFVLTLSWDGLRKWKQRQNPIRTEVSRADWIYRMMRLESNTIRLEFLNHNLGVSPLLKWPNGGLLINTTAEVLN